MPQNCKSPDQFLIQYNNIRSLKTQCKQTQLWALVWTCHIGWVNNFNAIQETCTVEFFDSKVSLKAELHNLLFKHFPSWFGQHFEQQKKLWLSFQQFTGGPLLARFPLAWFPLTQLLAYEHVSWVDQSSPTNTNFA